MWSLTPTVNVPLLVNVTFGSGNGVGVAVMLGVRCAMGVGVGVAIEGSNADEVPIRRTRKGRAKARSG